MRCASPPESVAGGAIQGQIVQADIHQKAQPRDQLLQDRLRDGRLALGERPRQRRAKKRCASTTDMRAASAMVLLAHRHGQARGLEALALAGRAGPLGHVLLDHLADMLRAFLVAPLQVGDDALESALVDRGSRPCLIAIAHRDQVVAAAVEQDALVLPR